MKDGAARCLLVTTRERNPAAPDAISAADLGLPDRATELWRGVIAPKDVPADRLKILEDGFRKAAGSARLKEYTEKSGERVVAGTLVRLPETDRVGIQGFRTGGPGAWARDQMIGVAAAT